MTQPSQLPETDDGRSTWAWIAGALLLIAVIAVSWILLDQRSDVPSDGQGLPTTRSAARVPLAGRPAIIFCGRAESKEGGKLELHNVLNEMPLARLPAKVVFTVVVSVTPDRPDRRYELVGVGTDGQTVFTQELAAAPSDQTSNHMIRIPGLVILRHGMLTFRLQSGGEIVAERSLPVTAGRAAATTRPADER